MQHGEMTILERLWQHAAEVPDCAAYTFLREDSTPDIWTFHELARRVRRLAGCLGRHAGRGDRVLLLYPPGLEFIEAFLGCLAAGLIAVPAYPPRRNRSAGRLLSIVRDSGPTVVLSTAAAAPSIKSALAGNGGLLPTLATDAIDPDTPVDEPLAPVELDTPALLQYTSGSTGTPRGVAVSHRNIACNERQVERSFGNVPWKRGSEPTVVVSWLPLFHDMGLIGGVLQPLYVGFPAVLLSPVAFLREPIRWLRAITQHRGTTSGAPNFAYDYCARQITEEQKQGLDLSSWRVAYNGAEPVRGETLDRFTAEFAAYGFRPETFFPCYGLAEATVFVSGGPPLRRPERLCVDGAELEQNRLMVVPRDTPNARQLVACGRPADGVRVKIVEPETFCECPPGQIGEIWLSSSAVAQGYWGQRDATRETFQARLAGNGEGPFLRTGDLGFLQKGDLFISGRLKDLIIIRGRNLYPQDLEGVVERVAPFVRPNTCAAFGIEAGGEERVAIVAEADRALMHTAKTARQDQRVGADGGYLGATQELAALVDRVRSAVSEEFEIPVHAVVFVRQGTFPRTSSGKVQRQACRAGFLHHTLKIVYGWRSCEGATDQVGQAASDPGTKGEIAKSGGRRRVLENLIHEKIVEWLRREINPTLREVRFDTAFTSVGLDSVAGVAVTLEVENATGQRIPLEAIYEHRTIRDLAEYLDRLFTTRETEAAERVGAPERKMEKTP
jgi:acyl-CoA synthetase (AMP-forming)/AMP-acid ligase II/acyl carrier protein